MNQTVILSSRSHPSLIEVGVHPSPKFDSVSIFRHVAGWGGTEPPPEDLWRRVEAAWGWHGAKAHPKSEARPQRAPKAA